MKRVTLKEIENYFKDVEFTDDHIQIDQCTIVTNIEKFYNTHLETLKKNSGNKLFMPFYMRLLKLYYFYKNSE